MAARGQPFQLGTRNRIARGQRAVEANSISVIGYSRGSEAVVRIRLRLTASQML